MTRGTASGKTKSADDELLTIPQVLAELSGVPRSTFYRWRKRGRGPKSIKLPNGTVLIRRSSLNSWLADLEESA
jgi:predicted DNA-binding transcriptional regulator AlpA